ncbi:class I SAM-dependent methyltransferase [Bacillus sp. EAC]|uniref:class I SAM-dependent methyltransferase n=1 Tax=Bacillus sp. EAC TaxID=1978338 RepID=UPI000B43FC5C|nr:class I SAM-dependent methyltransferase [Bacillus sp. EAC]
MNNLENFTGKAEVYSKYRPIYPKKFIDYLLATNDLNEESNVVDIGSGTGILSRQLLEVGMKVIAIEPNNDMRSTAEHSLKHYSGFQSIEATAEHSTLNDNSIDLITVAQAFHWFDKEKFKAECQRILKKDSKVLLVWNSKDLSKPLMMELQEICKKNCPKFKGFSGGIEDNPEIYIQFFKDGKYEYQSYQNDLEVDYEGFLGRNLSSSFSPVKTDKEYGHFISALTNLFKKYSVNGKIILPNITKSYLGQV